ncbi:MAG: sulfite exporter TauE/SafE family protein [Anaerolineae bacterium]|nr:sulfite exporter TauE/SafE family protein [Anaerolineae bacterium]MDW8099615.1 sulfite exporter TauE/SafE family protein [Anaerolineae bacterium]
MEWYLYPAVVAAGFICGFVNVLAGSGSLVTLPLLIFLGMPATVANGTNRIGILLQNLVGARGFYRHGLLDLRQALWLAGPASLGAVMGAQIAADLDEAKMERAIGALMIFMLIVMLIDPQRWLHERGRPVRARPTLVELGLFFLIGIYGGFIQVGVGIFLLAGLVLGAGFDLVRANAIKVLIILVFTVPALVVFLLNQQVNWGIGLILSAGNVIGAWAATRLATRPSAALWIHRLLVVAVMASSAELLGVLDWIARWVT